MIKEIKSFYRLVILLTIAFQVCCIGLFAQENQAINQDELPRFNKQTIRKKNNIFGTIGFGFGEGSLLVNYERYIYQKKLLNLGLKFNFGTIGSTKSSGTKYTNSVISIAPFYMISENNSDFEVYAGIGYWSKNMQMNNNNKTGFKPTFGLSYRFLTEKGVYFLAGAGYPTLIHLGIGGKF